MISEIGIRDPQPTDIWVLAEHREDTIEEATFGLIAEARRLISDLGVEGTVTVVALGFGLAAQLDILGAYGAGRVMYVESESLTHYQGELFARVLSKLAKRDRPSCILVAQTAETSDLCARLAALLETGLVTCAMDLKVDRAGKYHAIRPVANGYLFEHITLECNAPIVSFLPSVLTAPEPDAAREAKILYEPLTEQQDHLETKLIRIIEADPEDLDIEEADIIVAGGRGVGKNDNFDVIHELAQTIGGSVAGTRPVIDWQTLPYERQIGQTGKMVAPRLIINCGISGANEYTTGMEKAHTVIAINTDPHARIFRFADLGVVGDLHSVLPLLISRLKEIKKSMD